MVLTLLINLPVRSEVLACWSDPLCVPWPGCEAADDALSASPVRLSSSAGRHELLIPLNTRTKTPHGPGLKRKVFLTTYLVSYSLTTSIGTSNLIVTPFLT